MANLSPVFNDTQLDDSGNLLSGGLIYTYVAGSVTPLATYTTSDGSVPQLNPIVLNARGEVSSPIWLAPGQAYKLRLFDSANNFIREFDNVTGIGDNSVVFDQWQASNISPTYVNGTQFTLPGDQTSTFSLGRRIKATVTAGTVYGTITASVFTTLTTVTVLLDSGVLDTGLSSVAVGIITPDNSSIPSISDLIFRLFNAIDNTKKLAFSLSGILTGTTRTWTVQDKDITVAGLDDTKGGANLGSKIQSITAGVSANALTITLNPTTLDFRSDTLPTGTPTTVNLPSAISIVIPNTATLGTVNATPARLAVIAINNAGTIELSVVNPAGGFNLDESGLISTIAITTGSDSANVAYSTTLRSNVAYRVVGYIDITEATAGTWATAPTLVQGSGGNSTTTLSIGFSRFYESPQQIITSTGPLTLAHGLGRKPLLHQLVLICTIADSTFSIGDELVYSHTAGFSTNGGGVSLTVDATNLNIRYSSFVTVFTVPRKSDGVVVSLTNSSWRAVFRAWA